jgi:hypothetical protein
MSDKLDKQFGTSFAPPSPKTAIKSPIAVISPKTKLDLSISTTEQGTPPQIASNVGGVI